MTCRTAEVCRRSRWYPARDNTTSSQPETLRRRQRRDLRLSEKSSRRRVSVCDQCCRSRSVTETSARTSCLLQAGQLVVVGRRMSCEAGLTTLPRPLRRDCRVTPRCDWSTLDGHLPPALLLLPITQMLIDLISQSFCSTRALLDHEPLSRLRRRRFVHNNSLIKRIIDG